MASPSQDQRNLDETPTVKEMMHKTKNIQFFGRTTPIILQNDNGPCPLLAICNILLLRNNLSLSSDVAEVSQEKLLSLVAERLIDSNSNVNNKDAGYVENQQQNIADAIDLLPRLATGIDVNIKFRKIDDFEFTRECAIFDLLDIPLCHGWLVDPQDFDTSNAIGSKSYNTLMGELVALETQTMESFSKNNSEEDSVDTVALTTNLEVPPSLSRGSLHPVTDETETDLEKETMLSVSLKLSKTVGPTVESDFNAVGTTEETSSTNSEVDNSSIRNTCNDDLITFDTKVLGEDVCSSLKVDKESRDGQINTISESEKHESKDEIEKTEVKRKKENISMSLSASDSSSLVDIHVHNSGGDEKIPDQTTLNNQDLNDVENKNIDEKTSYESCSSAPNTVLESSKGTTETIVESNLTDDGKEPIYGEKHILEMSSTANEVQEPIYEAEGEKDSISICIDTMRPRPGTTARVGELIRTFLKNSASQLTIYGLFSLQDGLKERELCVFFRNNHFNTMFKFEGELYILATDQGYLNQPDLIWEKLNEVNGDTVFVDNNFKKFIAENHETRPWDVQNAMANTAEYLARIDKTAQGNTSFNSDLQLAIALQQQELEQQQPQQPQQPRPQSPTTSRSGLVVGPQHVHPSRPRNSSSSSRQETKPSKEKCTVM